MSAPPRATILSTVQQVALVVVSCLGSASAHGGALAAWLLWQQLTVPLDTPGEETDNDGPIGDGGGEVRAADPAAAEAAAALQQPEGPVSISLYVPPAAAPVPEAAPADAPVPEAPPTEAEPVAAEAPRSTAKAKAKAKAKASAGGERAPAGGEEGGTGNAAHDGVPGQGPKGAKKPCEPTDEVVQLSDDKWRVERDLIDWYASHLRDLEKQVGVSLHKGGNGARDGAKLYLPKCSVLRQGGLKNGDIVHTVNGEKVTNVPQAFAAYMKVRKADTIKVELTRKDGSQRTHIYKLK